MKEEMKKETFEQQIKVTWEHMETLPQRARVLPDHQQVLFLEALEGLSATLENLQAAGEELLQKNGELTCMRQAVEAERQRYPDGLDITDRKKAEERLMESEKKYRELYERSHDGFARVDMEGNIKEFKPAFRKMLGYSEEELKGLTYMDLTPEKWHSVDAEIKEKILKRGYSEVFEKEYKKKDGTLFPVELRGIYVSKDENGNPTGIWAFVRDITERKRAELEYKTIVRTAMDGFWITDMQGRILEVNDAYCHLLGYTRDELLNMAITDVEAMEKPEETALHIRRVMELGGDRFETRHRCKDGRIVDIEVSVNYIQGNGGRLFVFLRDITERKRASEEIRKINEDLKRRSLELEAANKELEAFSYSVSHDLRTPIISIGGFSRLVSEEYSPCLDEKGQKYLETIYTCAQRSIQLMDSLLALSRAGHQELNLSEINMEKLLEEIFREMSSTYLGQAIQWDVKPLPPARGDQIMIRQVIVNLLTNAIKFTRPKGTAKIEIGWKSGNGQNIYYVKDNGIGFDMEDAGKLFEVFKRLPSSGEFEGAGVGLAIVQRIIQRHGGSVWAEGKVNEGATFYFTLPRVE